MDDRIKDKLNQLTNAVRKMRSMAFSNLVNWDYLSLINIGETVKINNTFNTKILQDEYCIIFKTIIPSGEQFPLHWHDFIEEGLILYGEVKSNDKIYKKGYWIKFDAMEKHKIVNDSSGETGLIVIFTK